MRNRSLMVFAVVTSLSACGGGEAVVTVDNNVASVGISANATTIAPGSTVQMTAIPKNAAGSAISGLSATWTSSNNAAATVSATGLVTAVANGSTTITGTVSGKSGTQIIVVATITPTATANVDATVSSTFEPQQVDITSGGTVTWRFATLTHNVTFNAATGTPANISDTQSVNVARTFSTAGTFNYQCTLHNGMTGRVIVH